MRIEKTSMLTDRTTLAWLILVISTGVGLWLGQAAQDNAQSARLAVAGVIIVAFIKVWIVGFEFMELKSAPRWLKHGFDAWVVAVSVALLSICLR